jgi:hypothetical protein
MNERSRLRDRNMTSTSLWPLLFLFWFSLVVVVVCRFFFVVVFWRDRMKRGLQLHCLVVVVSFSVIICQRRGTDYEKLKRVVAGKERGAMDIYLGLITL